MVSLLIEYQNWQNEDGKMKVDDEDDDDDMMNEYLPLKARNN